MGSSYNNSPTVGAPASGEKNKCGKLSVTSAGGRLVLENVHIYCWVGMHSSLVSDSALSRASVTTRAGAGGEAQRKGITGSFPLGFLFACFWVFLMVKVELLRVVYFFFFLSFFF